MYKFLISLLGFMLMVVGFFYIIIYINLLSFGYSLTEYFSYLISRYECWFLLIGLILIIISLVRKGRKNDNHI